MKRKLLVLPLTAAIGALALSSYSTGPWQNNSLNRTGSAGAGTANCSGGGCHGANSTNTTVTITVTDAGGNAITSYTPGATYTVNISGRNTSALTRFGLQSTVVQAAATSTQAGTFTASSPLAVRTASTPDIVEQTSKITGTVSGGVASYAASYSWTAPAAGAGTVRFLATLNAVNNDGGTSGDEPAAATPLDLTEGSGTNVPGVNTTAMKLYPNPAANTLQLQLPDAIVQGSFQIRDIRGSLVSGGALRIQQGLAQIDVAGLSSGAYFVQVRSAAGELVAPFVKQ